VVAINGVGIPYAVLPADTTPAILASHIAATINAATMPDPISGLPMNAVVSASAPPGIVTIRPVIAGRTVGVACSVQTASSGTSYTAKADNSAWQVMISGAFAQGDTLTTILDQVVVPYVVTADDSTPVILASHIASVINATASQMGHDSKMEMAGRHMIAK
jgi:hypothetical protein